MLDYIVKKTKLNTTAMLRHGTVAVLEILLITFLFGTKYAMIAFPMSMTSLALSKGDIQVDFIRKTLELLAFDILIVTLSFLAGYNVILSIVISFCFLFFIGFFLTVNYNPVLYKPFLMLYIFTVFNESTFEVYLIKLKIVIVGVLTVVFIERFMHKGNNKNNMFIGVSKSINFLLDMIKEKDKNLDIENIYDKLSIHLRTFVYKVYCGKSKRVSTTNIGRITYEMYVYIETLKELIYDNALKEDLITLEKELLLIKETLDKNEILKYKSELKDTKARKSVNSILLLIQEAKALDSRGINKAYKEWEKSGLEGFKDLTKNELKIGTIRTNFALRLSILLTTFIALGHIIEWYKFIWIPITIMSVINPYQEETIKRIKDRLKGNIIGILIAIFVINITHNETIIFIFLLISTVFVYGFKEYYKLSTCTTIASLCATSLGTQVTGIGILRILYVLLGLVVLIIANRFLFPYKLEKGLTHLIKKLLVYNKLLLLEYKKDEESHMMQDIIILASLMEDKLYTRNLAIGNENIKKIIDQNNRFLTEVAFQKLQGE